jgi:hypothetical protein
VAVESQHKAKARLGNGIVKGGTNSNEMLDWKKYHDSMPSFLMNIISPDRLLDRRILVREVS